MTGYVDGFVLPMSKKNLGNPLLNIQQYPYDSPDRH